MTIIPAPITGFPLNINPLNNITPFTYRDGLTYLEVLESFRCYINDSLIPQLEANDVALNDAWADEVTAMIDAVNLALTTQATGVNEALEAQIIQFNEALSNAMTASVQDPIVSAIMEDDDSDTRGVTDALYASKATQTVVESGRLTEANLDNDYASKTTQNTVESGRLSATALDAKYSAKFALTVQTTNATPTLLVPDTLSLVLANDTTLAFEVTIVARRTDADNESAGYTLAGVIDRNANAASTALVGTVVKTVMGEDTAAWDVSATANTTTGALDLTVTGEAAKTIKWVGNILLTTVTG